MAEGTPRTASVNWADRYETPDYQSGGWPKSPDIRREAPEWVREQIKQGTFTTWPQGSRWACPVSVTHFKSDPHDSTSAVISEHRLPKSVRLWGYSPVHAEPHRNTSPLALESAGFNWEGFFEQETIWLEYEQQRMLRGGIVPVADKDNGYVLRDFMRWESEHPDGNEQAWERQYTQPVNLWSRETKNRCLDETNAYENSDDFKSAMAAYDAGGPVVKDVRNTFDRVLNPEAPARYWHAPEPCCLYLHAGIVDSKWDDYIVTAIGRVFFLVGGAPSRHWCPERFGTWNGPTFFTSTAWGIEGAPGDPGTARARLGTALPGPTGMRLVMEIWKVRVVHIEMDDPRGSPLWLDGAWFPQDHIELMERMAYPITMQGLGDQHTEKQVRDLHRGQDLLQEIFWYKPGSRPRGTGKLSEVTGRHLKAAYVLCQRDMPEEGWVDQATGREYPYATQTQVGVMLAEVPGVERLWSSRSVRRVQDRLEAQHGRKLDWPPDENWPDD